MPAARKPRWSGARQEPPPKKLPAGPLFFRGYKTGNSEHDWQLVSFSINDWYGYGCLVGLGLEDPLRDATHVAHYAGRTACVNQYLQGIRDGKAIKRAGGEPALLSVEEPEEPGQEPTEQ